MKRHRWKVTGIIVMVIIVAFSLYVVFGKMLPYYQAKSAARSFLTAFHGKSLREGLNAVKPFLRVNGNLNGIENSLPKEIRGALDKGPVERITSLQFTDGGALSSILVSRALQQEGYTTHNLELLPFRMTADLPLSKGTVTYEGTITMVNDGGWRVGGVEGLVQAKLGSGNFPYLIPANAREPYTNSTYMATIQTFQDYMFPLMSSASAYYAQTVLGWHSLQGTSPNGSSALTSNPSQTEAASGDNSSEDATKTSNGDVNGVTTYPSVNDNPSGSDSSASNPDQELDPIPDSIPFSQVFQGIHETLGSEIGTLKMVRHQNPNGPAEYFEDYYAAGGTEVHATAASIAGKYQFALLISANDAHTVYNYANFIVPYCIPNYKGTDLSNIDSFYNSADSQRTEDIPSDGVKDTMKLTDAQGRTWYVEMSAYRDADGNAKTFQFTMSTVPDIRDIIRSYD